MSGPSSGGADLGEVIAAVAAAVAGLTGWLTTRGSKRQRAAQAQVEDSVDALREDLEVERQRVDAAMGALYDYRGLLRAADIEPPELPEVLRARPRPRGEGHGHGADHDDD